MLVALVQREIGGCFLDLVLAEAEPVTRKGAGSREGNEYRNAPMTGLARGSMVAHRMGMRRFREVLSSSDRRCGPLRLGKNGSPSEASPRTGETGSARIAWEASCQEVPALLAGTDSYRLDLAGWVLREEVRAEVMGLRTIRLKGP